MPEFIHKVYGGKHILGFGTPNVIMAAWESDGYHIYEVFIFLVGSDRKIRKACRRVKLDKSVFKCLEKLVEIDAVQTAKTLLDYEIIYPEWKTLPFQFDLEESPVKPRVALILLKHRHCDEISWITENTKSEELKNLIGGLPQLQVEFGGPE